MFQGLIVMVSVVWQLANPILRLIAAVIMFVFSLFSAAGGFFDVLTLVGDFLGIFSALANVFTTLPVIPQQVNFRTETRAEFRSRAQVFMTNETNQGKSYTDGIAALLGLVWDYKTDDCMANFSACACRNLVIDEGVCAEVRARHKRGIPAETGPVLRAVAQSMTGGTFCDHHLRFFENTASWEQIWPSDRAYYIECMEKVIQGGRLNDVNSAIPADLFYSHEAPLHFWDNIRNMAIVGAEREHQEVTKRRQAQRVLPDDVYEQRWTLRNEQIDRWARNHPRWKKSRLTAGLIKIDQFEHKWRTGFYVPMLRRALANIRDGNIPRVSIKERFAILANHLPNIARNLIQIQIRQAAGEVLDGLIAIPEALNTLRTRSWWSIYWEAVGRAHAQPRVAAERKAHEATRETIMTAMRSSPIYQWWYSNWTESWRPKSGPLKENPFARLANHLRRVFTWQRAQWQDSPTTIMNADLRMKQRFTQWFERRFRMEWTPQIEANWASAGRMWYRVKERIWPGSVDMETKERFAIGPNCNITWNKRTVDRREAIEKESLRSQARRLESREGIGVNCSNASQFMRDLMDTRTHKRGFIVGGNCLLMDGFIDELVFLTTYCVDVFKPQLPPFMQRSLADEKGPSAWKILLALTDRPEARFNNPETTTWVHERPHETEDQWQGWGTWLRRRSLDWVRPKFRPYAKKKRTTEDGNLHAELSQQQWLRARLTGHTWRAVASASSFDFFSWFIDLIDSIFGTNFAMTITDFLQTIQDWFLNTNTAYFPGPVGWTYWSKFFFRCQVQPEPGEDPENAFINLNCKVGIGLEAAIGWVVLIMFVSYVFFALVIPPLTGLYTLLPVLLVLAIAIPAVAWHWSIRCALMTPSLILPGEGGVGITVPYWPFPIAFPALPFCLMDEITALVRKYTSFCWCEIWWGTPLEFICPPYAVLGNPCPPCPERISITNCNAIGLGGGIDAIIYLSIQWIPASSNWIKAFAQLVFFTGHFGSWLAMIGDYIYAAAVRFTDIPEAQEKIFRWCFGFTATSMAGVILFFVLAWLIIGLAWTLLVLLVGAIWDWAAASPFFHLFGGAFTDNTAYDAFLGSSGSSLEEQAYVEMEPQGPAGIGQRVFVPVRRRGVRLSLLFAPVDRLYARAMHRLKQYK